jgi:hypothetical protein
MFIADVADLDSASYEDISLGDFGADYELTIPEDFYGGDNTDYYSFDSAFASSYGGDYGGDYTDASLAIGNYGDEYGSYQGIYTSKLSE